MDLSRLIQLLQQEREGRNRLRPISLLRALKRMIGHDAGTRRNNGLGTLDRPESLEVRQVLSATSPTVELAPIVFNDITVFGGSGEEQGAFEANQQKLVLADSMAASQTPDIAVVQMVRDQLSLNLLPTGIGGQVSATDGFINATNKASTNRTPLGSAVLNDDVPLESIGGSDVEFMEVAVPASGASIAETQLNLSFIIEYNSGPQEVAVENLSSTDLQITVSGLAGTIYETSGTEFTAQVFYQNAVEVLQRVQPSRPVQILFPVTSPTGRERLPTIPSNVVSSPPQSSQGSGLTSNDSYSKPPSDLQDSLTDSLANNDDSTTSPEETIDNTSLIDQIFGASDLMLDTSALVNAGVARVQQVFLWAQPDANTLLTHQQEDSRSLSAGPQYKAEPASSSSSVLSSNGGLTRLIRRGLNWLRSGRIPAAGLVRETAAVELAASFTFDSTDISTSSQRAQRPGADGHEWLSWLLSVSSKTGASSRNVDGTSIYRSGLSPEAVPVFSASASYSNGARFWNQQLQLRKYREQHRLANGHNGAICISIYEHNAAEIPQSADIPAELKYVANPRGPPVYGRDADVPLFEVDAPADLLERLRYSIAPRGPSLATVETQSPDFEYFSGPRMSPEKVSTDLTI